MATSGSFNTSARSDYAGKMYFIFSWNQVSQSIENNTTTISWSFTVYNSKGSSYYYCCTKFNVTIDGTTVWQRTSSSTIDCYGGQVLASGTYTIPHNADGTRSFTASGYCGYAGASSVQLSGSGTWTLTQIPRSSSFTVKQSGELITSAIMGTNINFDISNDSLPTAMHDVCYTLGSNAYTILSNIPIGSYTWSIDDLQSSATNSDSVSIGIFIKTYYNGSQIATSSTQTINAIIPLAYKPLVSINSLTDSTGILALIGLWVKGYSKPSFIINAINSKPDSSWSDSVATISTYSSTLNGTTYTGSNVSAKALTGNDNTINATATDNRGKSSSISSIISASNYSVPSLTASFKRTDSTGTIDHTGEYIVITLTYSLTSIGNNTWSSVTWTVGDIFSGSASQEELNAGTLITSPLHLGTQSASLNAIATDLIDHSSSSKPISKSAVPIALYDDKVSKVGFSVGAQYDDSIDAVLQINGKAKVIGTGSKFIGDLTGNSDTSSKSYLLNTARAIFIDLESSSAANFDGGTDISPGVTGILQPENGGTGASSLSDITVAYATNSGTASSMTLESKNVSYSGLTSGVTVNWMKAYKTGNIVSIYFKFTKSGATSSGSNALTCTLTNLSGWLPPYDAEGFGYYSACAFGIRLESDGSLTVRNASASSRTLSDGIQFHLTYVVE